MDVGGPSIGKLGGETQRGPRGDDDEEEEEEEGHGGMAHMPMHGPACGRALRPDLCAGAPVRVGAAAGWGEPVGAAGVGE